LKPNYIFSSLAGVALFLAGPAFAEELRGAALIKTLNGKTFQCAHSKGDFTWAFKKSNPQGNLFPYTADIQGKRINGSYKLLKNGKVRHAGSNSSRKVVQNKDGSLTVSGNGVPTAKCIRR